MNSGGNLYEFKARGAGVAMHDVLYVKSYTHVCIYPYTYTKRN